MGMQSLAVDLKKKKIPIGLIHPGFVKTDLTGGNGLIEAPKAAEKIIKVMNDKVTLETSGMFWNENGKNLPW